MKLTTRQHTLKNYLEQNFVPGKYFTIEEICAANIGYELNTNPRTHDKCIALSNDVKQLNWSTNVERYVPIIKDKKGSIKLCENRLELEDFISNEKRKVEKVYQYANHLQSLIEVDGSIPVINLANRALDIDEMKAVDVYKKGGA